MHNAISFSKKGHTPHLVEMRKKTGGEEREIGGGKWGWARDWRMWGIGEGGNNKKTDICIYKSYLSKKK